MARLGHSQSPVVVVYSIPESIACSDLLTNVRCLTVVAGSIRRWKEDSIADYLNEHLSWIRACFLQGPPWGGFEALSRKSLGYGWMPQHRSSLIQLSLSRYLRIGCVFWVSHMWLSYPHMELVIYWGDINFRLYIASFANLKNGFWIGKFAKLPWYLVFWVVSPWKDYRWNRRTVYRCRYRMVWTFPRVNDVR